MYSGFWGLKIVPGKTYSQLVDMPFRVSNAALDATIENATRTSVLVTVDGKQFTLCSLTPASIEQQTLDITFTEGEEITFETQGDNAVHLTGNFVNEMIDDDDSEDEDDDEDVAINGGAVDLTVTDEEMELLKSMEREGLINPGILGQIGMEEESDSDADYDSDDAETDGRIREVTSDEELELVAEAEAEEEEEEPVKIKIKDQAAKKDLRKEIKKEIKKEAEKEAKKEAQKEAKADKKRKAEAAEAASAKQQKQEKDKKPATKDLGGGLTALIQKEGTGAGAKNGQRIGMYYIGKLTTGRVFDQNTRGKPFWFRLGAGEVIRGWDKGILGMKKGGERRLTIPANLAYGKRGAPPDIPPNATLVFDIRLVDMK
ncbi:peptidylprolyl isomerase fpr3 [Coemansia erecta]|uniref:FK506-binding protein n=1 Tax=Coemansia erecta TaxID=147472 RepID=A0A9W7Y0I6_9FUNG|nr:peptidylprolyl isomerase fpr3 [Coemansia erecta]